LRSAKCKLQNISVAEVAHATTSRGCPFVTAKK
jgi:hypothetical protein